MSGDYGFKDGNDYYIIGRKKDIVIVAGNNIYPEDVEAAMNELPGVIPGRVVAFGEEDPEVGTERLSLVAETHLTNEAERQPAPRNNKSRNGNRGLDHERVSGTAPVPGEKLCGKAQS